MLAPSSRHAFRGRVVPRLVSRLVPRLVLLACLGCPAGLIRSSGGSLLPASPCPSHPRSRLVCCLLLSVRLSLGCLLPSRRLIRFAPRLVLPRLPVLTTSKTGREWIGGLMSGVVMVACLLRMAAGDGYGWRTDGGDCLPRMATGCGRSSTADGCGRWRGLLACLGAMDGAARSSLDRFFPLSSSHHLIISSTGRNLLFPFRPTPSRLLFSACLPTLVPPSSAGGCAGLCHGLRRRACGLLAFVLISRFALSFRSLAVARSLVAIRFVSIVPLVPAWGVVGRFMGYSARYFVGVGVSQNMPVNRILWLLMGIFGDGVCFPFSVLPVASFSSICPALRPVLATVSWCWCWRVYAVSLWKRRVFVLSCSGALFASRVMEWAVPVGGAVLPCRGDGVGGSSCLALSACSSPAPWGGGLCEVYGRRLRLR